MERVGAQRASTACDRVVWLVNRTPPGIAGWIVKRIAGGSKQERETGGGVEVVAVESEDARPGNARRCAFLERLIGGL